jgi:hypothetical protein
MAFVACFSSTGGTGDPMNMDDAATDDAGVTTESPTLPDGTPNPCIGATDCGSCTDRTPCGWCNGECKAGTVTSSFDGTCTGDAWMWRGVQCPGIGMQCPGYTTCGACANDTDPCGWCANTHQCVAGDRSGPAIAVDGCTPAAGTWVFNLEMMTCP